MAPKSDIPFGGDFSPNEVSLLGVLDLAAAWGGDRAALNDAVRSVYYEDREIPEKQKQTLAYNVTLGMEKYGLIQKSGAMTPLALEIYAMRPDELLMHRRFATHILVDLPGASLVECVLDMTKAGEKVTLVTLREALLERGLHTPTANKHMSLMKLWLEQAGVFTPNWGVNRKVYEDLLGLTEPEIEALANRTAGQRAVMRMLSTLGPHPIDSSKLRVATERAQGVALNEKSFPKDVLDPLHALGYLDFEKKSGKSGRVTATPKLLDDVTIPLLDQLGAGLPAALRHLLTLPLPDIVSDLDSPHINVKGLALEALGFKILRTIGLDYRGTRYRPSTGGRFEVDLVFDSRRLAFSRWQVQCKNTSSVSLDDVAKEVGLTYRLLSNVILVLTRGTIGAEARGYANDVMRKTSLAIVLMDGADVEAIVKDPLAVFDVLDREASFALELKPLVLFSAP